MSYPFRKPNYKHQQLEFDQYKDAKARALLWQMRTGKSKACIDLACYAFSKGRIDTVIVIAPNGVHLNWEINQLPAHHWHTVPYSCLSWSSASARTDKGYNTALKEFLRPQDGLRWFCINSESITFDKPKKFLERLVASSKGVLLIVDESQDFRTPGSKRGRLARNIAKHCIYKRILTGSGFDNSPLHAWGQFEILKPAALGFKAYGEFENQYATKSLRKMGSRQFPVVDGFKNQEELRERIAQYASVVLREECDDMPELLPSQELFELSDEQRGLYSRISHQIIVEDDSVDIPSSAVFEGGVKNIKLQQVTSGFFINEHGEPFYTKENPRREVLKRVVSELAKEGKKFIIWCRFTIDIGIVSDLLDELNITHVQYYGQIKTQQRMANMKAFMTDPSCLGFVGNPKAGGRGLDLSAARYIIWYSRDYDLITRRQADERATHIGGQSINVIDLLALNTVDQGIIKALEEKVTVSEVIDRTGLQAFLEGQTRVFDEEFGL